MGFAAKENRASFFFELFAASQKYQYFYIAQVVSKVEKDERGGGGESGGESKDDRFFSLKLQSSGMSSVSDYGKYELQLLYIAPK